MNKTSFTIAWVSVAILAGILGFIWFRKRQQDNSDQAQAQTAKQFTGTVGEDPTITALQKGITDFDAILKTLQSAQK